MYNINISRTFLMFSQLVELKNGETYNGHLVSCDNWMNINLREVICTSRVSFLSNSYMYRCHPCLYVNYVHPCKYLLKCHHRHLENNPKN